MKKNKPVFIFFAVISVMLAILAAVGVAAFLKRPQPAGEETTAGAVQEETTFGGEEAQTETTQTPEQQPQAQDTWNAETVYTGGDEVVFGGKCYRAKWWTQGETPDPANGDGPWEYIGDAQAGADEEEQTAALPENVGEPAVGESGFKVVGYYPSWEPSKLDRIQLDVLTHINYAFAIPTSDGGLRPLDNPQTAKQIIDIAHKHGVKVLIAVGGWSYNDVPLEATFMDATASDDKIKKLVDSIVNLVNEYGFDGADMDWEHPRVDGDSSARYTKLMTSLSAELKKNGKLLTAAVLSGVTADGNVYYDSAAHKDAVIQCVDWFNVMAYDGGDGDRHSPYDFAVNSASYWKNTRKMPAEKVVLGVPFYARPSWAPYSEILTQDSGADGKDIATYQGMEAHYNGVATIKQKTQWALENIGGVMMWEISQDTTDKSKSLLSAIGDTIRAFY